MTLPEVAVGSPTVSADVNYQVVESGFVIVRKRPSVVSKLKVVVFETALVRELIFPALEYANTKVGAPSGPVPSGSIKT